MCSTFVASRWLLISPASRSAVVCWLTADDDTPAARASSLDGDFGLKTLAAIKGFQTWDNNRGCSIKLTVDGKVGKHTWSALRSDDGCPTV